MSLGLVRQPKGIMETPPENKFSTGEVLAVGPGTQGKPEENGKQETNDQSSTKPDVSAPGSDGNAHTAAQVTPGAEHKSADDKTHENETEHQNTEKKVDNVVSPSGGNSRKRKRKKVIKPKDQPSVVATPVSGNEQKVEEKKEQGQNSEGKSPAKNRKKKKTATASSTKDTDKPENSTKEGGAKSESMGMIFMCSSKTKQDCYNYKVFGLPAAKKDMVAKIYKGMRLFLFDIDLKLLYGIYKAAEPGGYNIEPKAFKSAFPSQVRFSVFEDCLPLSEEKFKAVIKDNYYGKNKFDCQLKAEQVKNLCKLFKATTTGKSRDSKHADRVRRPEARSFPDRSRDRGQGRDRERRQGRDREMQRGRVADRRHGEDRVRRVPFSGSQIRTDTDAIYESQRLPLGLVAAPYGYERPMDIDYPRRDTGLERHDRRLVDMELGRREEILYHDPHGYIEPPPVHDRHLSYQPEPLYARVLPSHEPSLSRHEPLLYSRHPPPVHEASVSYHDSVYARDAPPVYLLPHGGYRY